LIARDQESIGNQDTGRRETRGSGGKEIRLIDQEFGRPGDRQTKILGVPVTKGAGDAMLIDAGPTACYIYDRV
jgi:hypothetical protein